MLLYHSHLYDGYDLTENVTSRIACLLVVFQSQDKFKYIVTVTLCHPIKMKILNLYVYKNNNSTYRHFINII